MSTALTDAECHQRLIAAADDLFNRQGTHAAELVDIARRAGVPEAQATKVVASKDALVEAVLAVQHERWMTNLGLTLAMADEPRDELLAIFTFLEGWFSEDDFAGCVFMNAYGELGRTNPRIVALVREHSRAFTRLVDDIVARAGLPGMLAVSIVLLAEGAQIAAATMGTVGPAREARTSAAMLMELYDPR